MAGSIATSTIVSEAFRLMELSAFSSFGDDSDQARAASEQYQPALKSCLEQQDWSFARELVSLKEVTLEDDDVVDEDLPNAYVTPADFVKLRFVEKGVNWRLDREFLRADKADGLIIRYTFLVTNETKLPALFQEAASYKLAVLLAPEWVGSRTKRADLLLESKRVLASAVENDLHTASLARYDGQDQQPDWAGLATS